MAGNPRCVTYCCVFCHFPIIIGNSLNPPESKLKSLYVEICGFFLAVLEGNICFCCLSSEIPLGLHYFWVRQCCTHHVRKREHWRSLFFVFKMQIFWIQNFSLLFSTTLVVFTDDSEIRSKFRFNDGVSRWAQGGLFISCIFCVASAAHPRQWTCSVFLFKCYTWLSWCYEKQVSYVSSRHFENCKLTSVSAALELWTSWLLQPRMHHCCCSLRSATCDSCQTFKFDTLEVVTKQSGFLSQSSALDLCLSNWMRWNSPL